MTTLGWPLIGALLTACALTVGTMRALLASSLAQRALDRPNDRSMHHTPTPRIGGLALLSGATLSGLAWGATLPGGLITALVCLVALSYWDDLHSLPAATRLPVHALLSALATYALAPAAWSWPTWFLVAVGLTWAINLYNFMDGLDGLAGGQAAIGLSTYAFVAQQAGHLPLALSSGALVGGALGFLIFNLAPARVFMGDAGATGLGLLAGALGLLGIQQGIWSWWLPILTFLPFVVDASLTLALRALTGQRVWQAHRQHAYQRLRLMGWSASRTAWLYYSLMGLCAALAIMAHGKTIPGTTALFGALGLTSLAYSIVQYRWHRRCTPSEHTVCS